MKTRYIEEPSLLFGHNQHLCPKAGIVEYNTFDINLVRPEKIVTGIIGKSEGIQKVCQWLEMSKTAIEAKKVKKGKKANLTLFPGFCGFNKIEGFMCEISYDDTYLRHINNSEIENITRNEENLEDRILAVADLYLAEIKYLTRNKKPDVILCVLGEDFMEYITMAALGGKNSLVMSEDEDSQPQKVYARRPDDDEDEIVELEQNFRRYLKAKAMQFQVPIQIVRDRIANPTAEMQDPATISWNFFTALYYKAGGTPWALIRKDWAATTCYAGLSFYKSRDKKITQTSIAQIFNEQGKGVILRGEEIVVPKWDNSPHLTDLQAFNLLSESLKEYLDAIRQTPTRLVLHKTSNFNQAEISGFRQAAAQYHIQQVDMITIMESDFRLYREGQYPPLRGTQLSFTPKQHVLYTRGSVPYYETYTGMYIPRPLEIRLFNYDESPDVICEEIVALTKMNWNNTQFDRKFPITIDCARNVGSILKYLGPADSMQLKYSFYM